MKAWRATISPWWEVEAMRKLLAANYSRLWKDKFYWVLLAFMSVGSVVFSWMTFNTAMSTEETYYVEDLPFNLLPMIGFVSAFFISLRVGTEFDNHTIRNKLIVGHSRTKVFFGEYLICLLASLILLVVMLLFSGISGYILFRKFALDWKLIVQMVFCSVLLTAVFSTMFVGISMNIYNKAVSVVVNLVFLYAILFLASFVGSALNEAKMSYEYVRITAEGGMEFGDMVKILPMWRVSSEAFMNLSMMHYLLARPFSLTILNMTVFPAGLYFL